ncbi:MAG: chemotaxis protein CheB [Methylococcaceae bacterium]|jgi:two-component system response regulator WspF
MKLAIACHDRETQHALRQILAAEPGTQILWTALSTQQVLDKCRANLPDLLLLDIRLGNDSAAALTRELMPHFRQSGCSILLLNDRAASHHAEIFEALGNGAADAAVIPARPMWDDPSAWHDLRTRISTLQILAEHARKHHSGSLASGSTTAAVPVIPPVVVMGASTGGPKALAAVLSRLPADLPAIVLVVQHLDAHFTEGLAHWLDDCCPLPVAALTQVSPLEPGRVWIAARPEHLIVDRSLMLNWTTAPPERVCCPAIDVLFESVASRPQLSGLGVLLTGMGRDGAAGLLALRQAGFHTIAQDEATSVVYGMPKAAAELAAAHEILPLEAIGPRIAARLRHSSLTPKQYYP